VGEQEAWIEIDLGSSTRFNCVAAIEPTYLHSYGSDSRIQSLRVEASRGGAWHQILSKEERAGVYAIDGTDAERIRLTLTANGPTAPGISEFAVYAEPPRN
jgi:hypothetical protein